MTAPTIDDLPQAPSRNDSPDDFVSRADAFVAALPDMVSQINESTAFVDTNAAAAVAAAAQAAASANVDEWNVGTSYSPGDNVFSPVDFQTYRRKTSGSGGADPSANATDWALLTGERQIARVAVTGATTLTVSQTSAYIDITSGGDFTVSFDPVASLGANWFAVLHNRGGGDVTLDPDASEQIDGETSFIMYPGEARLIQCDGSALYSVVLKPFFKTYTANGSFQKPPGYSAFGGSLWGGGASGGHHSDTAHNASGGGGGACVPFTVKSAELSASEAVAIAASAAGVTGVGPSNGTDGNDSTFAGITAYGGYGGKASTSNAVGGNGGGTYDNSGPQFSADSDNSYGGGAGGTASDFHGKNSVYGGAGGGADPDNTNTGYGGSSVYGGAGGGGVTESGGTSIFGGNGGAGVSIGDGVDGTAPAGGGGGSTGSGRTSGAGARGQMDIWGIA